MIQWLRLCTFTAGDTGSIPGQGIKILHAMQHSKKIFNLVYRAPILGRANLPVLSVPCFVRVTSIEAHNSPPSLSLIILPMSYKMPPVDVFCLNSIALF